jgi:hypothetical protein
MKKQKADEAGQFVTRAEFEKLRGTVDLYGDMIKHLYEDHARKLEQEIAEMEAARKGGRNAQTTCSSL